MIKSKKIPTSRVYSKKQTRVTTKHHIFKSTLKVIFPWLPEDSFKHAKSAGKSAKDEFF